MLKQAGDLAGKVLITCSMPMNASDSALVIAHTSSADQNPPPHRFIAGADAIAGAERRSRTLKAQIEANRDLSTSLAFD